jgi:hypothetical protein
MHSSTTKPAYTASDNAELCHAELSFHVPIHIHVDSTGFNYITAARGFRPSYTYIVTIYNSELATELLQNCTSGKKTIFNYKKEDYANLTQTHQNICDARLST